MALKLIVFSPTGGTERAARALAAQWGEAPQLVDLCDPQGAYLGCELGEQDEVVVAMPSYGGRAPAVAVERLGKIAGNGAACTLLCVYGNRAYEDTLVEMFDAATAAGFAVVAAVEAVAQHSIMEQYAANRPDAADIELLGSFGRQLAGKRSPLAAQLPGTRPYKKAGAAGLVPKPTKSCTACGQCALGCPVQAIEAVGFKANPKACISCMRCVRQCPEHARKASAAMIAVASMAIKKECSKRKECRLFL